MLVSLLLISPGPTDNSSRLMLTGYFVLDRSSCRDDVIFYSFFFCITTLENHTSLLKRSFCNLKINQIKSYNRILMSKLYIYNRQLLKTQKYIELSVRFLAICWFHLLLPNYACIFHNKKKQTLWHTPVQSRTCMY